MRRFFLENGVDPLLDNVGVKLVPPPIAGSSPALQYELGSVGMSIPHTGGIVTTSDLAATFKSPPIGEIAGQSSTQAHNLAMVASLMDELEAQTRAVSKLEASIKTNPKGHSLHALASLASRLREDERRAASVVGRAGYSPPEAQNLGKAFDPLIGKVYRATDALVAFRAAHPRPKGQQALDEEKGIERVAYGEKAFEKGGLWNIAGVAAYGGAATIAIIDGLRNIVTAGYFQSKGDIDRAYERGDISWDEAEDLEWAAVGRAVAVGVVTVALSIATAGMGAAVAGGLGLVRGTLAYTAASAFGGGVAGAMVAEGSILTQHFISSRFEFDNPAQQSIWAKGQVTPGELGMGMAAGAVFGALGGARAAQAPLGGALVKPPGTPKSITLKLGGFTIDLTLDLHATGTHADGRVLFVTPKGAGIYRPSGTGLYIAEKVIGNGGLPADMVCGGASAAGDASGGFIWALPEHAAKIVKGAARAATSTGAARAPLMLPPSGAPGPAGAPMMLPPALAARFGQLASPATATEISGGRSLWLPPERRIIVPGRPTVAPQLYTPSGVSFEVQPSAPLVKPPIAPVAKGGSLVWETSEFPFVQNGPPPARGDAYLAGREFTRILVKALIEQHLGGVPEDVRIKLQQITGKAPEEQFVMLQEIMKKVPENRRFSLPPSLAISVLQTEDGKFIIGLSGGARRNQDFYRALGYRGIGNEGGVPSEFILADPGLGSVRAGLPHAYPPGTLTGVPPNFNYPWNPTLVQSFAGRSRSTCALPVSTAAYRAAYPGGTGPSVIDLVELWAGTEPSRFTQPNVLFGTGTMASCPSCLFNMPVVMRDVPLAPSVGGR